MRPSLVPSLVNGRFGDAALFVGRLHERDALLFDLGGLSALSARDLLRVSHVFVSHMHIDHFIGFDALLRVHVGRDKRIAIVGPVGIAERIGHKLAGYEWDLVDRYDTDLVFDVAELVAPDRVIEARFRLKTGFAHEPLGERVIEDRRVVKTPAFAVDAVILEHHGPSLAFAVSEPLHVNVWANRVAERGLSVGGWLKPLKAAVRDGIPDDVAITLPDGGVAPLGALRDLVSVERGRKLAYATDFRDTAANRAAVVALADGADTLFIEARFADADAEQADRRAHLTTTASGEIARAAGVRRVEPFHFSPRYEGEEERMIAEVQAAFKP